MIALIPTEGDLENLVLENWESKSKIHLTLIFLGEAVNWNSESKEQVLSIARLVAHGHPTFEGRGFGANFWNPDSEEPCWVLGVGGYELDYLRSHIYGRMLELDENEERIPNNHRPWVPHICLAYTSENLLDQLVSKVGPITFDRIRVAFGEEVTDIALSGPDSVTVASADRPVDGQGGTVPWKVEKTSECPDSKPWGVVNTETGDVGGRCHESKESARQQQKALYVHADEKDSGETVGLEIENEESHFENAPQALSPVELQKVMLGWNGPAAMSKCANSDSPASCYRSICAGRRAGDPSKQSTWALPHHATSGGPPDEGGVRNALSRLPQTQGLSNASAAKSHLEKHMRSINPDYEAEAEVVSLQKEDQGCPPGQHEMDGKCMPDEEMAISQSGAWKGPLVVEGITTGDGREFAPGALDWPDPSETLIPLRWNKEDSHGGEVRTVAVNVGRIDKIWREDDRIMGQGVFDLGQPDGAEAFRRVQERFLRGISVDADDISNADVEYVWPENNSEGEEEDSDLDIMSLLFGQPEKIVFHKGRIRGATLCDIPAFVDAYIEIADEVEELIASINAEEAEHWNVDTRNLAWDLNLNEKRLPTKLEIRAARHMYAYVDQSAVEDGKIPRSSCRLPHHNVEKDGTISGANIDGSKLAIESINRLRGGANMSNSDRRKAYDHLAKHMRVGGKEPPEFEIDKSLVASVGNEWKPSREWFEDPRLNVLVPIMVTDAGRVYGHAAQWGQCHLSYQDTCIIAPREDGFPYFLTGELTCSDGSLVAVGQITVDTGHPPLYVGPHVAMEHYDNTGAVVADVVVGNDRHGIWVAGAIRPDAEVSRVHKLRASGQVSPDWRRIGGQLRMIALLTVNGSGYQVPKMRARVASGHVQSLVAAGRVTSVSRGLSEDELSQKALRVLANRIAKRVGLDKEKS